MRLVTVTPAGRRPYLEVLAAYLLRRRDTIAEHRWWLNTREPEDMAFIYRLTDRYPDFFKIVSKPMGPKDRVGYTIWQYMSDCTEADTIYLRLDDDVCYMADDAVTQMRDARLANPEPFLILGNIVNNAICTHFHQQAGIIPRSWGTVGCDCMDPVGWQNGPFVRKLHRRFLKDLAAGREEHWKNAPIAFNGLNRYSINAICWKGEDFQQIDELYAKNVDEEPFLTADLPRRFNRPNMVCQQALFGHYAFCVQRAFLEATSPDILARYRRMAQQGIESEAYTLPFWEQSVLSARRAWGVSAWATAGGIARTKRLFRKDRRAA